MNNSKKINEKSPKKVYSRSDRAITLIALIITIIVLLILAGVTISLAVSNQGVFNKAKVATGAYKDAAEGEQTGLDEADREIEDYMPPIPGSTLKRSQAQKISVSGLKYADLDGDGVADGIIVADISKDSTDTTTYKGGNPWSNRSFSYTTVTTGLKEYSENKSYKYTNADGSTVDGTLIKCTNNTGTPRYYVLSLANYDGNAHYWYKNAYGKMSDYSTFTSTNFGKGLDNTNNMIKAWNNEKYGKKDNDIWKIIQYKEGWFVPSQAEWAAFASYLNISKTSTDTNYYANYGLNNWYWSSSPSNKEKAWDVQLHIGNMTAYEINNYTNNYRLCEIF